MWVQQMKKIKNTEKGIYFGIGIIFLLVLFVFVTHFRELSFDKVFETSFLIVTGLFAGIRAYFVEKLLKIQKDGTNLTFKDFIDNTELTRLLTIYFIIIPLSFNHQNRIEKKYIRIINILTYSIYGTILAIILTMI